MVELTWLLQGRQWRLCQDPRGLRIVTWHHHGWLISSDDATAMEVDSQAAEASRVTGLSGTTGSSSSALLGAVLPSGLLAIEDGNPMSRGIKSEEHWTSFLSNSNGTWISNWQSGFTPLTATQITSTCRASTPTTTRHCREQAPGWTSMATSSTTSCSIRLRLWRSFWMAWRYTWMTTSWTRMIHLWRSLCGPWMTAGTLSLRPRSSRRLVFRGCCF